MLDEPGVSYHTGGQHGGVRKHMSGDRGNWEEVVGEVIAPKS